MQTVWRDQLIVVAIAGLVFFSNLGAATLFDEDEPKNAVCGREMFARGDWIVPTFNEDLRTDKPILIYWIMLCSYSVFGVSEFAARFGSATLAVGTSLLTYHLGRKLFEPAVGLMAAIVLCTCLMFAAVGRAVTPDSMLICCTTGIFCAYVWAVSARHGGRFGAVEHASWQEFVPATAVQSLPMFVAMGLGVLAKGPVAVILPCGILSLFLLIQQQREHRRTRGIRETVSPMWRRVLRAIAETLHPLRIWRAVLALRLPLGAVVVATIALPWYIAVGVQTGGAWLAGFLGGHNVGRFLAPMENHSGPIVYYIPVILLGCFPWSIFLPMTIWTARHKLGANQPESSARWFILCWSLTWIGFFSCAQTKLPNYVLPAYPALALLIGGYLVEWSRAAGTLQARSFRHACRVLAVAGGVMVIAAPIAASIFFPTETWLAAIGLVPLTGGIAAYLWCLRGERQRAVVSLSIAAVMLAVSVVGIAPPAIARHQDGPQFGRLVQFLRADAPTQLGTYDYFAPNLVFYSGGRVERLKQRQVQAFLGSDPRALLLTRADRLDQLADQLPSDVTVLSKQRRFLRKHDLVLLGRLTQTVQPASHTEIR